MLTIKEDIKIVVDGVDTSVIRLVEENAELKREIAQHKVLISDLRDILDSANKVLKPISNDDIVKAIEVDLVQEEM